MTGKPLTSGFSIIMHIIQIMMIAVGGAVVFMELKGDVRVINEKVTSLSRDVDKIVDHLCIWQPSAGP